LRTRIKICGITRPDDAAFAANAGADAIGLVFHARSPRAVTPRGAREIVRAVPPFVTIVALFLDPEPDTVEQVLRTVPIDLLQFHGRESAEFCRGFGMRYIKAMPMADDAADPARFVERFGDAAGFLLDSHGAGESGGTGVPFDWSRYPGELDAPLILAGGLSPDNVAEAIAATRPWAVDVSSGVESGPGLKDRTLIATFIREVQRVERD